jgi:hypothetical protein
VDPPGRAARLSFVAGTVSFQAGGVEDWVAAVLNRPMTTGDRLWVDDGGRAELNIGPAAIRLNSHTGFSFLNLDDRTAQIQLSEGSMSIRVRRLDERDVVEVDTPNVAFSVLRPGEYRIDVQPEGGAAFLTVLGGEGEATGGGQAFAVHARQQARVTGTDRVTYDLAGAPVPDAFDNWCMQRDRRDDQSISARYVSREVVGYSDLDTYGDWRPAPDYGTVWYPRGVAVGWAPYRFGHWAWIAPWGWTWVDDSPWGFAPFHYGRWAFIGGYWGWVPGPIAVRPVYAPALVAWVGGPRFGVSIGIGVGVGVGVGWIPLGPREVFVPSYAASAGYWNRVNVSNTVVNNVTVNNYYNNRTVINNATYVNQHSVTAMGSNDMAGGRPVSQAMVHVPPEAMRGAQYSAGPAVAPTRQAVFGNASAGVRPPASAMSRPVVTRNAPPPAPVPFAAQQRLLQQNPGQPLSPSAAQGLRQNPPAASSMYRPAPPLSAGSPAAAPASRTGPSGNFSPMGSPNPQPSPRPSTYQPRDMVRPTNPSGTGSPQPNYSSGPPSSGSTSSSPSNPRPSGNATPASQPAGTQHPQPHEHRKESGQKKHENKEHENREK